MAVLRAAMLLAAPLWLALLATVRPLPAQAAGISAIGNEAPIAFAISPFYARTHMVAAVAVPVGGCTSACVHLWITRDGGGSWHRAVAQPPGMELLTVANPRGGERLVTDSPQGVEVSDDDGATWQRVGPAGRPAAATPLGSGAVVVAGRGDHDYVLDHGALRDVRGSSGIGADLAIALTGSPVSSKGTFALLALRDRESGVPLVQRCDATLMCAGGAALPGATGGSTSGDISLLPAPDFSSSGTAFVRTASMLYTTLDGGRSFVSVPLPPQPGAQYTTVPAAVLAPGSSRTLYVAVLNVRPAGGTQLTTGGVYVTRDRGTTWQAVGAPGPLDGGATAVAATPDGHLLAGYVDAHGDAGLVCSAGTQWRSSCGVAAAECAPACGAATGQSPGNAPGTASSVAASSGSNSPAAITPPDAAVARGPAAGTGAQAGATGLVQRGGVVAAALLTAIAAALTARRRRSPRRGR